MFDIILTALALVWFIVVAILAVAWAKWDRLGN